MGLYIFKYENADIRAHLPRVGLSVFSAIRPVQLQTHNRNTGRFRQCGCFMMMLPERMPIIISGYFPKKQLLRLA